MIFAKNITISRIFAFVLSIILVVSGLCFMPETSVSAAEAIYYVSPDGNDTTGNGSKSAPYATLKKTFTVLSTLDSLIFCGTVYPIPSPFSTVIISPFLPPLSAYSAADLPAI